MSGVDGFSAKDSARRLGLVQDVLDVHCKQVKDPALLVIPGLDGKYNVGSQRLIKYLFLGANGENLLEPTIKDEFEMLEDCVLCILPNKVKIFYGPKAESFVQKMTSLWSNIEEFRLLAGDFSGDAAEEERFKIQSMIEMIRNHKNVVLPSKNVQEENHEQWPLVQAFGLDEFHTGGFLSATHTIFHLAESLCALWSHIDSTLTTVSGESQHLLNHWNTSVRLISKQVRERGIVDFSPHVLFEPLMSFFEFGTIRPSQYSNRAGTCRQPAHAHISQDEHMFTVYGQDPSNGISCVRTYFVDSHDNDEHFKRIKIYGALATTYNQMFQEMCQAPKPGAFSYTNDPSRGRAMRRLKRAAFAKLGEILGELGEAVDESTFGVLFESFDLAGQVKVHEENSELPLKLLHYVEMSLNIGSDKLVIGDTFIENAGHPVVLTNEATMFLEWDTQRHPEQLDEVLTIEVLGRPLRGRRRTPCLMEFGREKFKAQPLELEGHVHFYEKGFVFEHGAFGSLMFNFDKDIERDVFVWHQTGATIASFEVQQKELGPVLSPFHCGQCTQVGLVVYEKSELGDALHHWRESLTTLKFENQNARIGEIYSPSNRIVISEETTSEGSDESSSEGKQNDTVTVFIVTGPPAGGKTSVGRAIAKQYNAPLIQNEPLLHGIHFEPARFRKKVVKAFEGGLVNAVVVVTPGDSTPEMMMSAFEGVNVDFSITAVVSVPQAFYDNKYTKLIPGLQSQCASSFVDTIVLTGVHRAGNRQVGEFQDRLCKWNQHAEIFRINSSCQPGNVPVTMESEFWSHQDQVVQRWDCANRRVDAHHHEHPTRTTLETGTVYSSKMLLKRNRLVLALQRLTDVTTAKDSYPEQVRPELMTVEDLENSSESGNKRVSGLRKAQQLAKKKVASGKEDEYDKIDIQGLELPQGQIISVFGHVTFESAPNQRFAVSASRGSVKIFEYSADESKEKMIAQKTLGLVFVGISMDQDKKRIEDFVTELQTPAPLPVEKLSLTNVTEKQKKAINKQLASTPLPSGFWFDGRNYMDHTGIPLEFHPQFEAKLQTWISSKNEEIREHNRNVSELAQRRRRAVLSSF
uniref:DAAF9 N-terminal domain-containing protein n=1 Tax=Mucochytrium quahogii TaxID=96639 RepID=A0A7S2S4U4_9STRA|mmetsp:Transcript_12933/g.23308  ORF Transcript_12933/g.23308 Transcript_12933/m.23308 type:complete len:1086 (-) Transcript_12933:1294-4551(-)|eukprot:CAMPEP_0203756662 /NCGR_PEP_ID=MMETSP0098-20131031/9896_1 /ASSEMBLY_ACC=CAM_ASM_000208 /TAXON_ID=96639 /ORGANISM=" , Strain NY0313808BC1" /LENGTH=1085 /DNA_ID=CAMNT_0050648619 /DNA_START=184 /DNA_END=3441 /DNA_ORIENTATION=-